MPTLFGFIRAELSRGYQLEYDEERYSARREKVYTFMRIPKEVEKFMGYGFLQCTDAFLFLYTFLPLRFILALWTLITRPVIRYLSPFTVRYKRILQPSEQVDLLKGIIILVCCFILSYIDTAMIYHIIKSQSVIKLYIFYNMLEVFDRLCSVFGQDIIDSLFWTATETKDKKREHFGVLPHLGLTIGFVLFHSTITLLQATTLNVAINSSNKALLTIMMSNNFVELKSSVFKKFDKNNLFQLSCADVRERFHLVILLLVVVVQTMREYVWREDRFWVLLPDCLMVLVAEILVDWVKHAFITRFNEIPSNIYREFTISLAYDLAQTKQKYAFTDHSDLVARRMGFIPLPLVVLVTRIISQAVKISDFGSAVIIVLAYLCLISFRILNNIITLGKACDLIEGHQKQKAATAASNVNTAATSTVPTVVASPGPHLASESPSLSRLEKRSSSQDDITIGSGSDMLIEPNLPRSFSVDGPGLLEPREKNVTIKVRSVSHSPPRIARRIIAGRKSSLTASPPQMELSCQPIFSNSTVSLTSVCLNEEIFDEDIQDKTLTETVPQHSTDQ